MGVFYRDTTSVSCLSLDSRAPRLQDVSLSTFQSRERGTSGTRAIWIATGDQTLYQLSYSAAPNSGLTKFHHGKSVVYWCSQQNSSTVELVDYTYDGRARRGWMHKVHYTLVDCSRLTPLLRFLLDLLYKSFLHCCAAVGKILTDTSRRAVPRRQLSFLYHSHYWPCRLSHRRFIAAGHCDTAVSQSRCCVASSGESP